MELRLLGIIVCYGIVATFFSVYEWPKEGIHLMLNMPANLLAESIYTNSIEFFGQSTSSQAHYTIPWILRIPQVIIPVSVFFWAGTGVIIQLSYNHLTNRKRQEKSNVCNSNKD